MAAILALGLLLAAGCWVGFQGGDDHFYAKAALAWLTDFPPLGTTHWALRYPVVLSIAASFRMVGVNELGLALPFLASYLGLLVGCYAFFRKFVGESAGIAAVILAGTMPALAVAATFAEVDIFELAAAGLSLGLYCIGISRRRPFAWFLASGAAAGVAWLTRETTFALLLLYGLLYLAGLGAPRRFYFVLGAGFAIVVGAELVFDWWLAGDPLYRYHLSASHDVIDRSFSALRSTEPAAAFDTEGNLLVSPWLTPLVALFAAHQFGIVFYLFVPACIWLWQDRKLAPAARRALKVGVGAALTWILFIALNPLLYIVPRYFTLPAFIAALVVAVWLWEGVRPVRPWLALVLGLAAVGINLLGLMAENKEPLYAERQLLSRLDRWGGATIHTDPATVGRVELLALFEGRPVSLSAEKPPAGGIYFYNPRNIERCRLSFGSHCFWPYEHYRPDPAWASIEDVAPQRRFLAEILLATGLDRFVPDAIMAKLTRSNPGGAFYRAEASR